MCLGYIYAQRRRRRSGWSGQGRTTFQQVVGLISRLQRRSANEMVGPGVPRKLAFAQRVGVSRINRSRCFASRSCRSPARPDRTASAPSLASQPYFALFPVGGARGREKYVWTLCPASRATKECNNCCRSRARYAN